MSKNHNGVNGTSSDALSFCHTKSAVHHAALAMHATTAACSDNSLKGLNNAPSSCALKNGFHKTNRIFFQLQNKAKRISPAGTVAIVDKTQIIMRPHKHGRMLQRCEHDCVFAQRIRIT
jgi:hypothetical protein